MERIEIKPKDSFIWQAHARVTNPRIIVPRILAEMGYDITIKGIEEERDLEDGGDRYVGVYGDEYATLALRRLSNTPEIQALTCAESYTEKRVPIVKTCTSWSQETQVRVEAYYFQHWADFYLNFANQYEGTFCEEYMPWGKELRNKGTEFARKAKKILGELEPMKREDFAVLITEVVKKTLRSSDPGSE